MQTLHNRAWVETQSINYESIYEEGGRKIKISIKKDAYPFQSFAHGYLFVNDKWEKVASIPYAFMEINSKDVSHHTKDADEIYHAFGEDVVKLMKQIEFLLK